MWTFVGSCGSKIEFRYFSKDSWYLSIKTLRTELLKTKTCRIPSYLYPAKLLCWAPPQLHFKDFACVVK